MKKSKSPNGMEDPLERMEMTTAGLISSIHRTMENLQGAFQWSMKQMREIEQLKAKIQK